ncbi:unnamed protein product [Diatraea saccharalis]|uniref:Crossover junction endonuclease EME1 n=1 Tax=Diatraea saccharalis TaxID=40085 RepID=A0A9P0CAQ8_9NEOP|nr:unnamed protein product [Diatraea saccharalis]
MSTYSDFMDLTQTDDDNQDILELPQGSLEIAISKKSNTATERQAKKRRQAEEKAAKLAIVEANKIYKPGECMKYMCIEMHPSLSSAWYMSDVGREAASAGCRVVSTPDICDPGLVMWSRATTPTLVRDHDGQVSVSPSREPCSRALYVLEAAAAAEHVHAHTLAERLDNMRDLTTCQVTCVVLGVKQYFKKSQRNTANSNRQLMTPIDLEMAVTDMLVTAGCDAWFVETPNELALHIVQVTKAIAEAPFKLAKRDIDEQADFFMRGDNKNCIAVDQDGRNVSSLWQQMLSVLPHSSLEVSRAIRAEYDSPRALHESLLQADGVNKLSSLGVSRAGVPGARARRLGPEFATKLHTLFTCEDGDALVG